MIRSGDSPKFTFGILAEGRNIRENSERNYVSVGFDKSINSFDLI